MLSDEQVPCVGGRESGRSEMYNDHTVEIGLATSGLRLARRAGPFDSAPRTGERR
jgi:hypothetical protein